jgi:ribosomal protein S9
MIDIETVTTEVPATEIDVVKNSPVVEIIHKPEVGKLPLRLSPIAGSATGRRKRAHATARIEVTHRPPEGIEEKHTVETVKASRNFKAHTICHSYTINGKTIDEYFNGRPCCIEHCLKPLEPSLMTAISNMLPDSETTNPLTYGISVRVGGGGQKGQSEAVNLAVAKALLSSAKSRLVEASKNSTEEVPGDPTKYRSSGTEMNFVKLKSLFRRSGLLTCDARVKERKKYGLRKARKAPQYSKR